MDSLDLAMLLTSMSGSECQSPGRRVQSPGRLVLSRWASSSASFSASVMHGGYVNGMSCPCRTASR